MPARTALVSGGTSGIGRAAALALHARDVRVAVTGHDPENLALAREELPEGIAVIDADTRSLQATDRVVEQLRADFGTLNTLILNTEMTNLMPLESWTEAAYDDMFAINTKGAFFTLAKASPILAEGASVIFTVGTVASHGMPGGTVTSGSHGALLAMLPSLAVELAPRRIRVNAVTPGAVETPNWREGLWSEQATSDTLTGIEETNRPPDLEVLTARQMEVLRLIACGFSNRGIGHALHISPSTVSIHISNILKKLNVANRTEAAGKLRSPAPRPT